jgi:hypothetical protein
MKHGTRLVIWAVGLLTMHGAAWAQASDVTFTVPVNLTQLRPEVQGVAVECQITSTAIIAPTKGSSSGVARFVPTGGRVQTTATVHVPIARLDSDSGTAATYRCDLKGQTYANGPWSLFSANAFMLALKLTPQTAPIIGTFNWLDAPPANVAPVNVTTTSPSGTP